MSHPYPFRAGSTQYRYNWIPDKKDDRDHLFSLHVAVPSGGIPAQMNLQKYCSPVFDQGSIGSCTAQALAGLFEFAELAQIRAHQIVSNAAPEIFEPRYNRVSRLMIYREERKIEGTLDQDAGAELRDGIKALANVGVCREKLWAYEEANLFATPPPEAYAEASQHRIQQYLKLSNFSDMKHSIAMGRPFAFGMLVPSEMEGEEMAKTGILPMPDLATVEWLGGHAVMCVGYDDATRRVRVRNSWGNAWGQSGYFEIPYDFMSNRDLCMDAWALIKQSDLT